MADETAEPWLCACGELTLVTHWAWPNGVAVHDPELAYLEAAGIAEPGPDACTTPVQSDMQPDGGGTHHPSVPGASQDAPDE